MHHSIIDEKMLSIWKTCCSGISQRWVFAIMAFFGLFIGNSIRVILSITITEMVLPVEEVTKHKDDTCIGSEIKINKNFTMTDEERYNWDEYTQGLILSSYFWGYAATQFPFGTLSERFGGKYLLGSGVFIPSVLTFLIPPTVAWGGSTALIILRVLMGVISGSLYPASSTMISQWTIPAERTKFCSIILAGSILGTVFGTTMPAVLIRYTKMGWQGVFYFFGVIGMVWFPLWIMLCYNNPYVHPFVSDAELKYLQDGSQRQKRKKIPPAPWKHILTSKPFWAFVLALIGTDWAYFTMSSDLPKYMSDIVKLSIEDNGYLSSLPYLCMWFSTMISSFVVNIIFNRKWLSLTNLRKLFSTISLMGPALFILAASYAECDQVLVVTMFILGMTLMGCSYSSLMVNALDLSPNYSGTLWAIGNGAAALGGVLAPYIVGILTPNQTITEWRLVFWIVFGVAGTTSIYFLIFASAEVQVWDDPEFIRNEKIKINTIHKKVCDEQGL